MSDSTAAAARGQSREILYNPWLHGFALAVMLFTFVLLLAGGNVTSKAAGMAVPDWPLSFQSINPEGWTTNMGGSIPGVRDEHGHRLIGATVGFLVTVLAVWLAARDPRRWVKVMGVAAWVAVVIQGVMGGLRVTENSVVLATIHGCFAQAFFVLTVVLVVVTSRQWLDDARLAPKPEGEPPTPFENAALAWATAGCVLIIYIQLVLGAILRHLAWTWIPHMVWAVMVGLALMAAARYVFEHPYASRRLSGPIVTGLVLYFVQLALGLMTLIVIYPMWSEGVRNPQTLAQDWLPTAHLAVGAAILGLAAYLAVRAGGISRWSPGVERTEAEGVPA
ncbi:MAG TPA: COX15/CtaA family protein [Phycisphaerae bacterium]|nr:COX15/CtaA family protein [Phycisphaerae bacterium]HOM53105.1 COX15/CtaA family protein [Phycisphaerae bacterium]HPP25866.1 COX15/CtaA family protein [Phycisphaerae bacterium]